MVPPSFPLSDKKIPRNPRYEGVTSRLNLRPAAPEVEPPLRIAEIKRRPKENFRRLRASQFGRIMLADPEVEDERDLVDMLVLDVRPADDREVNSVRGSVSHPSSKLNHATNPFCAEMHAYKNREDRHPPRIVCVVDNDEKVAVPVANRLYEMGFDNVFILHRGMRSLANGYSFLVDGEAPRPPSPTASLAASAMGSPRSIARSSYAGSVLSSPEQVRRSRLRQDRVIEPRRADPPGAGGRWK